VITGRFTTASEAETRELAARLAQSLSAGAVVLLSGDLGTGKTVFVRGLAEGLGADADAVSSPTFVLVQEYRQGALPLVHVDLYRLPSVDLDDIGLDTNIAARGVLAVEWPERLVRSVAGAVTVSLMDAGGDLREVVIRRERRQRSLERGRSRDSG